MLTGEGCGAGGIRQRLEALASDLESRGFTARVADVNGYECVSVSVSAVPQLSENIHAESDDDGAWWFWWSWGDRIARVEDIQTASFKVAYVLTPDTGTDLVRTVAS